MFNEREASLGSDPAATLHHSFLSEYTSESAGMIEAPVVENTVLVVALAMFWWSCGDMGIRIT